MSILVLRAGILGRDVPTDSSVLLRTAEAAPYPVLSLSVSDSDFAPYNQLPSWDLYFNMASATQLVDGRNNGFYGSLNSWPAWCGPWRNGTGVP